MKERKFLIGNQTLDFQKFWHHKIRYKDSLERKVMIERQKSKSLKENKNEKIKYIQGLYHPVIHKTGCLNSFSEYYYLLSFLRLRDGCHDGSWAKKRVPLFLRLLLG